jgi:hypothetical protein
MAKDSNTQTNTQTLATTQQGGALAVAQELSFNLPALSDPQEAIEVMADNLAELGGNLRFDKVKIPSGGGLSFEVIDENGEAKAVTEIIGVVLDHYPINAFWEGKYTGENNPPDCSSMDAITGFTKEDTTFAYPIKCKDCPKNQWGSDPEGGKGKACKNMIRIYIVEEDNAFPVLLALPPTSTGNWKDYMKRLAGKMKSVYGVVTKVKLEKDKSEGGISYSKAAFSKAEDLSREEKRAIKAYAEQLRSAMRTVAIDSTEYNVPENNVPESDGQAMDDENPY